MTLLQFALSYPKAGLHVLPLHNPVRENDGWRCSCMLDCNSPAKHPRTANGLLDATTDPRCIEEWWRRWPESNVGIRTGAVSGIIVLDVDPRHGGDDSLFEIEKEHGELPPTWRFHTGGGGEHILFRHPGGEIRNSAGKLGLGLDARGDGGYIVAPPSRHISGRQYVIDVDCHPRDVPLASAPEWLLEALRTRQGANGCDSMPVANWRELISRQVPEGQRNDCIARLSGLLLRNLGTAEGHSSPLSLSLAGTQDTASRRFPMMRSRGRSRASPQSRSAEGLDDEQSSNGQSATAVRNE